VTAGYRLNAELGRGGTGVACCAHDTLLARDIEVKVLSEVEACWLEGLAAFVTTAGGGMCRFRERTKDHFARDKSRDRERLRELLREAGSRSKATSVLLCIAEARERLKTLDAEDTDA
jgi:hypothetical protein